MLSPPLQIQMSFETCAIQPGSISGAGAHIDAMDSNMHFFTICQSYICLGSDFSGDTSLFQACSTGLDVVCQLFSRLWAPQGSN